MDCSGIAALTFDCYGTLIDWDRGIEAALAKLPALEGCELRALVRRREIVERELESGPYRPYGAILSESVRRAAREVGRAPSDAELEAFAASVRTWPPFAESRDCLARLAARFRLAILSNIETATLRASAALLCVPFDALVTAEEVRAYKPRAAHFESGLRRLELPRERVLHVAQSHYHDVEPAVRLGWRVAWVNRLAEGLPEGGAAPDLEVSSLSELCAEVL